MKRLPIFIYLYMLMMFAVVQFAVVPLFNKAIEKQIEKHAGIYWRDIVSGFFHVIEADLHDLPIAKWEEAIQTIQPQFNFPITVTPLVSPSIIESERSELEKGDIAVRGSGQLFRHQIGDSGMVLTLGPIPEMDYDFSNIRLWFYSTIAVLFSIFALIWALPYIHKLKRISTAASEFGKGRLNVRAKVPARSSLAPLAGSFNAMADRIQELISSHKELTHAISHELRTPLARLRFSMEMLNLAKNPSGREAYLDGMKSDVNELDLLVSELLTYAKFDSGDFRPLMEQLDLGRWLSDLSAAFEADNNMVMIRCRIISPTPEVPALISPMFLERAVRNLLQNALRYTQGRIDVTLTNHDGQCIIQVDDDGPGIPLADRQRIFDPFVRVDADLKQDSDGYGLGLAIVRRVIEWHGGSVVASEAPIGGARFSMSWPLDSGT